MGMGYAASALPHSLLFSLAVVSWAGLVLSAVGFGGFYGPRLRVGVLLPGVPLGTPGDTERHQDGEWRRLKSVTMPPLPAEERAQPGPCSKAWSSDRKYSPVMNLLRTQSLEGPPKPGAQKYETRCYRGLWACFSEKHRSRMFLFCVQRASLSCHQHAPNHPSSHCFCKPKTKFKDSRLLLVNSQCPDPWGLATRPVA